MFRLDNYIAKTEASASCRSCPSRSRKVLLLLSGAILENYNQAHRATTLTINYSSNPLYTHPKRDPSSLNRTHNLIALAKMSFLSSLARRTGPSSTIKIATRAFSQTTPAQLARLTMVGRLGADPELKQSKGGNDYIQYVVGSGYGPKEARQTSWFRVASFAPEGAARDFTMSLTKG
jgi:hypothetical protein